MARIKKTGDMIFLHPPQFANTPRGKRVLALVRAILDAMRDINELSGSGVVSIAMVPESQMKKLNAQYRGKSKPTDVLSFEQPQPKGPRGIRFLGDLVICDPVLRKQARGHKHSVDTEAAVLLVHGLLHLLGYDHEKSAAQERKMTAIESKLLRKIGVRQKPGLLRRTKI